MNDIERAMLLWLFTCALLAQAVTFAASGRARLMSLALEPDEQDEFCSGCGARNAGNPCQSCRNRPGGG